MATISITIPTDGSTADAADVGTPLTTIANEINGNLDNANIKVGAAIGTAKLADDAGITTAKIADAAVTPAKLLAGTGTSWAWKSWTPTWTNFTIGNGTNDCKYIQIGKTVFYRVYTTLGGSSVVGTYPTFTLPVTSIATPSVLFPIGRFIYDNNGGSGFNGYVTWASTTTGGLKVWDGNNNHGSVSAVSPVAYASGHKLVAEGSYEVA